MVVLFVHHRAPSNGFQFASTTQILLTWGFAPMQICRNPSPAWKLWHKLVSCASHQSFSIQLECQSSYLHGVTILERNLVATSYFAHRSLCLFVEKLCNFSSISGIETDVSHIPGHDNVEADLLNRWDFESPIPCGFLAERIVSFSP